MDNSTVYCHGIPVPKVDERQYHFHNRMTCIYGSSGTGKSALTQHILNNLRDIVPLAIVACPTATMNGDYNKIIPDQCIYDDLTKSLIQNIFQRQQNVVAMYQMVRDYRCLSKLFYMVADQESRQKADRVKGIYEKGCVDVTAGCTEDEVDAMTEELTSRYHKKLVKIMRNAINGKLLQLKEKPLTEMQRSIISNFNINPSLVLIADDCMATVKEWSALEETKKLFFQGRHYHITTIILCQAETLLPTQLRANAHITVFTTESVVNTFINKAAAGFSNDEKKKISKIAQVIFTPSSDPVRPNFKKLVVFGAIVKTDYRIQYIIGSPRKKRFGSEALWRLCDEVKRESVMTQDNTFNRMFSIKPKPTLDSIS